MRWKRTAESQVKALSGFFSPRSGLLSVETVASSHRRGRRANGVVIPQLPNDFRRAVPGLLPAPREASGGL